MRRLISFLLIFTTFAANARQVTPEEAQFIASEFFNSGSNSKVKRVPRRAVQDSRSAENQSEPQPYYIFNADDNAGFVIISGDTRAKKILGYSDNGYFDYNNLPPQLSFLLNEYEKQIASISSDTTNDTFRQKNDDPSAGGLILNTPNWGQGHPYNTKCPKIDEVCTLTGCTATAMAIAMKYHNWPPASFGTWHWGADLIQVDYDFNTTFDWDNMLYEYSGRESESQIDAVAALMSDAGISVDTNYGLYESGAYGTMFCVSALQNIFRYHPMCRQLEWYMTIKGENYLPYYTYDEWTGMIRNEIDSNRPIIYSADNNETFQGHMFVCDGYDMNEMFHFNFGWNGIGNGYYALTAILPDDNNVSSYPNSHRMIIGFQPEESESEIPSMVYISSNAADAGLKIYVDEVKQNVPFEIFLKNLSYRCRNANDYEIGCALTTSNGNILQVVRQEDFYNAVFTVPIMSDYILKAVCRSKFDPDAQWVVVPGWGGNNQCSVLNPNAKCSINLKTNNNSITVRDGSNFYTYDKDTSINTCIGKEYTIYLRADRADANYHLFLDDQKIGQSYVYEDGITNPLMGYFIKCEIIADNYSEHVIEAIAVSHSSLTSEMVNCSESGTLQKLLQDKDLSKIGTLQMTGKINQIDFNFALCNMPNLYKFDASMATLDKDGMIFDFGFDELSRMNNNDYKNSVLQTMGIPFGLEFVGFQSFGNATHLMEVIIPYTVTKIAHSAFCNDYKLLEWHCLSIEPPIVVDGNNECESFDGTNYWDATLFVPSGSRDKYLTTAPWKNFKEIKEYGSSGINEISVNSEREVVNIYDINGIPNNKMSKGINIIIYNDGSSQKLLIK
ncbi:MAG: C10 family peptidase [Lachnoclostridium sp.]|nr:C10 family peptidase [Lachnoclostridium sp.]